jgi:hypothetical protein
MVARWERSVQRLAYWLFILIVSFLILYFFIQVSGVNQYYKARLGDMVYGTAYRPYVYRALLPSLVRLISPFIPCGLVEFFRQIPGMGQMLNRLDVATYPAEAFLVLLGLYLSLLGFVLSLRDLMRALGYTEKVIDWVSVAALPLMIPMFLAGYIYDFPMLFLFTLSLAMLMRRLWFAYLGVFLLASLNKETSILLTLLFAFHYWRSLEREIFYRLLAAQLVLFIAVKLGLTWIFRANPGGMFEYHLPDQLRAVQSNPGVALFLGLILCGLGVLIARRWPEQPLFLRHALLIAIPLGILYLFFSMPFELRVFYELYPVALLMVVNGLVRKKLIPLSCEEP